MAIHTAKIVDMVLRGAQRGSQGTASELLVRTHTRKCQSQQGRSQQTEFWLGYQRQQPVRQNQARRAVGYVFADRKGSGKKKKKRESYDISNSFRAKFFFLFSYPYFSFFFSWSPSIHISYFLFSCSGVIIKGALLWMHSFNLLALISPPGCQKHTFLLVAFPVVLPFPLLGFGSSRSASVSVSLPPFLMRLRTHALWPSRSHVTLYYRKISTLEL